MNQTQWDARIAARNTACGGCLWEYFKMDEASGFPLDSSGNSADMDNIHGSQVLAYNQGGPFSGADGIEATVATGGVWASVQNPPTNTANYGHSKTLEGWVNLQTTPTLNEFTLIAAGNIGIVIDTDRTLRLARWANPNTFSTNTATALDLGEWYFIMASSSGGNNMDLWVGSVTVEPTIEAAISDGSFAWPVPNGSLLRVGALPAFGEVATAIAIYSDLALFNAGNLTPDFPHTPQLVSMNAVIPTAGT